MAHARYPRSFAALAQAIVADQDPDVEGKNRPENRSGTSRTSKTQEAQDQIQDGQETRGHCFSINAVEDERSDVSVMEPCRASTSISTDQKSLCAAGLGAADKSDVFYGRGQTGAQDGHAYRSTAVPTKDCGAAGSLDAGVQPVPADVWSDVLRTHLGASIYQDWLQGLRFVSLHDRVWIFAAPSRFVRDWVENHYGDAMQRALAEHTPWGCHEVRMMEDGDVAGGSRLHHPVPLDGVSVAVASGPEGGVRADDEDQDIFSAHLDPRLTFDNFVVGKPNEFAYAAARRVAESDETIYNPLFLYGPVGHGKTHLMHSIAHAITQRWGGQKKILYLSAEKFMYYFIRALRYKNVMAFKERFRSVHVLMIDDVQFISGKDSTQEEFFHTFNALVDAKRQVVISADKSPSDLEGMQERMKSRLGWGLAADLHPTTYELRLGILHSKALAHGIQIPSEILSFLASHVSSSVRELEGALNKVMAHSTLVGGPLTLEVAQNSLRDILRSGPARAVTLGDIERRVCDHFHVRVTDLHSSKRARAISRPRQIAMYLAKIMTSCSLPAIGKHFGGRDHTTVMHAVATIEGLLQSDASVQEEVMRVRQALERA